MTIVAETSPLPPIPLEHNIYILPDSRKLGYAVYGLPLPGTSRTKQESEVNCTTCPPATAPDCPLTPQNFPEAKEDDIPTIIYCHGVPSCRLEAASLHDPSVKSKVRIIAIDRSGIGLSSPLSKRTILDFADDVRVLLGHLRIKRVYALGYSGGAPYAFGLALALSRQLPQHSQHGCQTEDESGKEVTVLGIGIIAGLAPWHIAVKTLTIPQRIMANIVYWTPGIASLILEYNVARIARQSSTPPSPFLYPHPLQCQKQHKGNEIHCRPEASKEADSFELLMEEHINSLDSHSQEKLHKEGGVNRYNLIRTLREVYKGSMKELILDMNLIISTNWGYTLSDIANLINQTRRKKNVFQTSSHTPFIKMWYGGRDENVPLFQGDSIKEEIEKSIQVEERGNNGVSLVVYPSDTHFSILSKRGEHILRSLLEST